MIKPGTNVCVRYLAERSCVWFSWLWKLHYNLQKGWQGERWSFPGSVLLMMTGTGSWTASPSFISCLFLWSLERHIALRPTCWFFGDTCYDNTSLPPLDTQSCCPCGEHLFGSCGVFVSSMTSLQPLGHLAALTFTLYMRDQWDDAILSTGKFNLCFHSCSLLARLLSERVYYRPLCVCI